MKLLSVALIAISLISSAIQANEASFEGLKNYQENGEKMVSSGLPNKHHFSQFKALGVAQVIDLIPGDRSDEIALMKKLNLNYHNIPVDWHNPTLDDFNQYAQLMTQYSATEGKTLTHCKLNWRGAVFTYLYRITYLEHDDATAKADMMAIWHPNETWQAFIDKVIQQYR